MASQAILETPTAAAAPAGSAPVSIPFGCPLIDDAEKQAVLRVLDGPILTHGPLVKQFELDFAAFTGATHAVATSSCAAALQLGAWALGVRPGDEVIVSAQTHVATAHAIELCGARCVFVDCAPGSGHLDCDRLESLITARTKAIALVHYGGFPAPMRRVMAIARRHHLSVIEDCALALGAAIDGTHVGLFGDLGCFSFYPVKQMTTTEGGMLITRRPDIANAVSRYRAFGIDRNVVSERPQPGMYDVPSIGWNCRMSEIGAALGIEQLKKLPAFLATRRRNFRALADGLAGVAGVTVLGASELLDRCGCYCLTMMLEPPLIAVRAALMRALETRGVGTSVYYPHPVPRMTYYRLKYGSRESDYPLAARISDGSIALPVGPHVTPSDIERIVASVSDAIEEVH